MNEAPGSAGGPVTTPVGIVLRDATPRRSRGLESAASLARLELRHLFLQLVDLGLQTGRLLRVVGLLLGAGELLLERAELLPDDFDPFLCFFIHESLLVAENSWSFAPA